MPYWDYKPTNAIHADSPGVYTSAKKLNLNTKNKIHLQTDVIDGSIVNGSRQPVLYSFVMDKPAGYEIFSEPETIHYKKTNKPVSNTIIFYLEDDNAKEIKFY